MSTSTLARTYDLPIDALNRLLGADHVITDKAELTFYSTDVYRRADVDAALIIRPGTVEELAEAVKLCTQNGLAVVARGGGLSYTAGYLPTRPGTVVVDMLRLDHIVEINQTDMYVTVECGINWKTLYEALRPLGLRTPYFGPMSGYSSTVGGALSQGSIFLGSTQFGTTADSVLGLEVVLADGSLLVTGSAGGVNGAGPFFRNFGPDLAGLFLNDSGALGFKVRATLRLMRTPKHSGFVSFTFDRHTDLLASMSEVSRRGLAAECYGADPYIWGMRLWDSDLGRDVQRMVGVVKSGRNLVAGLKDAVRIAMAGRQSLQDVEYAMNVAVDGRTEQEVEAALDEIRGIAVGNAGREVEASAPRAVRGAPFLPPNDILGPKGQRWAPSHGIAPHSQIVGVTDALHAFFEARAELLERHGVEWGYVTFAISTTAILLEPMLYWPGARELYHERIIAAGHLAKLPRLEAAPEAAAFMRQLRADLVQFWSDHGCVHLQIGKTYRYLENRMPAGRRVIEGIKADLDPNGLVNPGALGLVP
jgi:FAD/FMN-containing dehydrogenase